MIRLGYVLTSNTNRDIFFLDPQYLNRHACIFGTTGSGKSTTLTVIAYELRRLGIPILILDRTGEYVKKLSKFAEVLTPGSNFSISPFEIWKKFELEERVQNELWLLNEYCKITWNETLTPLQSRLITDSLLKIHGRGIKANFASLIHEVKNVAEKELKLWLESAESIVSRFRIFTIGRLRQAFSETTNEGEEIVESLRGITILDLSIFDNEEPKNMFSLLMATIIYLKMKMLKFTPNIRLTLAIDEAQNLLSKNDKNNIIDKMAMELRKYGLSLILISPRPSNIPEDILSNCATVISHQILSSYDIDIIKKYAFIPSMRFALENVLYTLKPGEAFIRAPNVLDGEIVKIGLKEHEDIIRY
ncbi:MAG: ATP-binding protein [Thermoproteota archaeon]